ncbi:hypothetical protein [Burkholderia stagnalis]|uniref:hypothetical protein n=1 Tax=Burkholderia stagnalis TaxID=1503054 RepID=UPI0012D9BB94|nr:hypothetical protein [Burkholderia stagnalis]
MNKIFIFTVLLLFYRLVHACGSDAQREDMAKRLYEDINMQQFVCGSDSCSIQDFKGGLQFHRYDESFRGKVLSVCLVEPVLSAANSYTEVFVKIGVGFAFQFISYGTGIKVGAGTGGIPMILEYGVSNSDNLDYSVNQYFWNGSNFILLKISRFIIDFFVKNRVAGFRGVFAICNYDVRKCGDIVRKFGVC